MRIFGSLGRITPKALLLASLIISSENAIAACPPGSIDYGTYCEVQLPFISHRESIYYPGNFESNALTAVTLSQSQSILSSFGDVTINSCFHTAMGSMWSSDPTPNYRLSRAFEAIRLPSFLAGRQILSSVLELPTMNLENTDAGPLHAQIKLLPRNALSGRIQALQDGLVYSPANSDFDECKNLGLIVGNLEASSNAGTLEVSLSIPSRVRGADLYICFRELDHDALGLPLAVGAAKRFLYDWNGSNLRIRFSQ